MSWSFRVARVFGIDVKIHITFFLIILLGAMQWSPFGVPGLLFGSLLMALLFLCVTLHELGHSVVAQRFGIAVRQIVLLPIGGIAFLARNPTQPLQELLIAIAGPAVNVVIAVLLAIYLGISSYANGVDPRTLMGVAASGPSFSVLLIWLLNANIALVLFNMIPAFPMDGGRVLRGILGFFMDWNRATNIAATVGQVLAVGFGALAIVTGHLLLAVIAAFVFVAAGATRVQEQARTILSTRRIGDVYNKHALYLDESDRVSRVVEYLLTSYQPDFAVLRDGELIGVVSRDQVIASLSRGVGDEPVTSIMNRSVPGVDASTPIDEVNTLMEERNSRIVAVYDRGSYLGLVSLEDLGEAMVLISHDQRRRSAAATPPPLPHAYPRPA